MKAFQMKKMMGATLWLSAFLLLGVMQHAHALENDAARQAWIIISQIEQREGIPAGLLHSMSLVETGQGRQGRVMPWPYTLGVNASTKKTFQSKLGAQAALDELRRLGYTRFNVSIGDDIARPNISADSAIRAVKAAPEAREITLQGRGYARRFETQQKAASFTRRLIQNGVTNVDIGLMQVNWKYHGDQFKSVEDAFDPYKNANYAVSYLNKHRQTRDWWESVGRYHSGTQKYAKRYIKTVWAMYRRVHRMV